MSHSNVFFWLAKGHLYATIELPIIRLLCSHLHVIYGEMVLCPYTLADIGLTKNVTQPKSFV